MKETRTIVLEAMHALSFFVFACCFFLMFSGFPFALVSWIGKLIVMVSYLHAIKTIVYATSDTPLKRFLIICVAFAIASFGEIIIDLGGLVSINYPDASVGVKLVNVGRMLGIVYGILNFDFIDK